MAYIVAEPCVKCKYTDCVEVCPVACFYEGENALAIHPEECIDCGACESECPTTAIFEQDDLPEKWTAWIDINAVVTGVKTADEVDTSEWPDSLKEAFSAGVTDWPKIEKKKDALPGADDFAKEEGKLKDLSFKPGEQ